MIKMFYLSIFQFIYLDLYFSGNQIKVCHDHFILEHGNLISNKSGFHTSGLEFQKDPKLSILSMSFTEKEFAPLFHLL